MADLSQLSDQQLLELKAAGGDLRKVSDGTLLALKGQSGPKAAPSPERPLNPDAKPSAPDYGGPNGERREWYQQPKTATANPATIGGTSLTDTGIQLNKDVRSVGRGVADIAGMPVDLGIGGLNALNAIASKAWNLVGGKGAIPPVTNPVGGSEYLQNLGKTAIDSVVPAPELDPADKTRGHVIEGATSSLALGGLLRRAALGLGRAGVASEEMNPFMRPYAQAAENAAGMPGNISPKLASARPLVVDTAAGAGGGAGQDIAEKYAPNSPLAALLASLGGGVGGATMFNLATAPAAAFKSIKGWLTTDPKTGTNTRVADLAARRLQEGALDKEQAGKNIREKAELYAQNGISPPTAGLMSEDPGLISVERGLRGEGTDPKVAGKFFNADKATRTSLGETVSELGDQNANPRTATGFANQQVDAKRNAAQSQVAQGELAILGAQSDLDKMSAPVIGQRSRTALEDASTRIHDTVEQTQKTIRDEKNARFDAAKEVGADVRRDIGPLQGAADAVRTEASKLAPESKILPQDFLAKIDQAVERSKPQKTDTGLLDFNGEKIVRETPGEQPSYADISGLRPPLKTAIAQARAENNGAMVEALVRLKGEVEGEGSRIAADAAKPGANPKLVELAQKIAAADEFYRNEHVPVSAEGAGGQFRNAQVADKTGAAVPPSKTAGRFFFTGPEMASDLAGIISKSANPQEGVKAVRDYLFSRVAGFALKGDKVDEQLLNKWMADNKKTIDAYPQVAQELRDLQTRVQTNKVQGSAAEAQLARAKENLGLTEKQIQDNGFSLIYGKDPHNAVESVFSADDPQKAMQSIVGTMGGKGSKTPLAESWKRAVVDYLESKISNTNAGNAEEGVDPVSLAKSAKMAARHDATLSEVFTPDEMNKLQVVRKAATDLARLNSVRATTGSNTAEDIKAGKNLFEMIAKSAHGQLKGGGESRTLGLILNNLGLMDEGAQAGRVLARAMHDPQLAVHLLERPTSKVDRSLWNKRLNVLMGGAAEGRESGKD